MKSFVLHIAFILSFHLNAQTIDTLMITHHTDGTTHTLSISKIDSIVFKIDSVAKYMIKGKVSDTLCNGIDSGSVFLLQIKQNGHADTIDISILDHLGKYEFKSIDQGSYHLRAEATAISLNAVNTYYPNVFLWQDALSLDLASDTIVYIDIIQLSSPLQTGSGMISGYLREGNSF
jgi:hypothetical protein